MSRSTRPLVAALAATVALLTGCATSTTPPEPPPTFVVLAAPGEHLQPYLADVGLVQETAVATGGTLIVSAVGDETAETLLVNSVMVGDGANRLERDKDLAAKEEAAAAALTGVGEAQPSPVNDVLVSLERLSSTIGDRGDDGPVHVVIVAPLESDGEPDLSDPAVLDDPVGAINALAAAGRIPDCDGWLVYGVGEGTHSVALREFWRLWAERCGGRLVAFTPHLAEFPLDTTISAPDRSLIEVEETAEAVAATVGGDVVFDYDRSEISPEAAPALAALLDFVLTTPGTVDITGHSDSRGSASSNHAISAARASAIAEWLLANGLPPERLGAVTGVGETQPLVPDAETEDEHRINRRVTVTVHAASTETGE